jgi:putative ABC transport system permease protein
MRSGLTRQALRAHRATLIGPACTQAVGAAVISMMIMTAAAVDHARTVVNLGATVEAQLAEVAEMTSVFIGVAVYMSIVIVGVTMNLAITGQLRDIALLRTIGASPQQVRRSVVLQAVAVAIPASVVGFLLAVPATWVWVTLLRSHGAAPAALHFTMDWRGLPIGLGVEVAASIVGTWVAARRVARISPAAAMTDVAGGGKDRRPVRLTVGVALIVGGVLLSAILTRVAPDQTDDAAFFVMLAECIGVGMLGPWLVQSVARRLGPVIRSGVGQLALDGLAARSRALSGALVPLVLAAAFALVKIASHTTAAHVTGAADSAADRFGDYSGTAVYCAFAGIAALNCLITVQLSRRRDLAAMQLAGGDRRMIVVVTAVESSIVVAVALAMAAGVATATLLPVLNANLGVWLLYVPLSTLVGGVVLAAGVVGAGMVLPTAAMTARSPIDVMRAAE